MRSGNLTVQGKGGLHSDEKTFDAEGLKHDFGHLFSVFRSVHRWLGQNEPVLLWLTPKVGVNGLVPELLDAIPVFDEAAFENLTEGVGLLVIPGFLPNIVVQVRVVELVFLNALQSNRSGVSTSQLTFDSLVAMALGMM